jgi:DNA-directed RNA polymerase subunit RPC12/RpoP
MNSDIESEWSVLECTKCNQIFATPFQMISDDEENYKYLVCPYCGTPGNLDDEIKFIEHKTMDCKVRKITKWIIE